MTNTVHVYLRDESYYTNTLQPHEKRAVQLHCLEWCRETCTNWANLLLCDILLKFGVMAFKARYFIWSAP